LVDLARIGVLQYPPGRRAPSQPITTATSEEICGLGTRVARGNLPGTISHKPTLAAHRMTEVQMGRGILLWLLGVPIPIIILLALFWR